MKSTLIFIFLIFSAFTSVLAQNLVFDGRLTDVDSQKRLGGVTVTVYEGSKEVFRTTTASNGKYTVNIAPNKTYRVEYSRTGFVSKVMTINATGINEEDIPIDGKLFPPIDIDLFMDRPNVDFSFLKNEPVVEWNYIKSEYRMWFNEGKMQAMKTKIENLLEKADEKGKENEEKYAKLIADADKLFIAGNYDGALNKYSEAIGIPGKESESHPNSRIVEIDNLLKKKAQEDLAKEQENRAYTNLIDAADKLFTSKDYTKAELKYKEAQAMRPAEQYPKTQLAEIEKIKKANANKAKIDELFASAEKKLTAENFLGAIEDYKAILVLESTNTKATTKKGEAEAKLKALEENKAQLAKFEELKSQADGYFANSKWNEALGKYEAAQKIIGDNKYVNDRVIATKAKIEENALNAEKQKTIKKLMDEAAIAEGKLDWAGAISKYEEVLKVDATNAEAKTKLEKAKKSLENAKQEAEKLAQFTKLKTEGDTYFAQKKWEDAKSKYLEAKAIQANPQIEANLKIINDEISKLSSAKEKEEKFKEFTEKAKKEEAAGNLEKALEFYNEALGYKDGDAATINKINTLRNKIAERDKLAEKEKMYSEAMKKGKEALNAKDYAKAIDGFEEAMLYKPADPEALKLKNQSAKSLAELSKNEAAYQKLLAQGLKLKNSGDLNAAKDVYVQAQQMRPSDPIPQNAIVEINDLLRKKLENEEKTAEQEGIDRRYEEKLDLAAVSAQNFDYENAIKHLKEASKIKPNESLPKNKIAEYQALLDQINASKTAESQYKDLIRKADLAYNGKNYEESIDLYNQALKVQDVQYPKDQITKAELVIKNQGAEALNRKYQDIIKKANNYFSANKYQNALDEYNKALEVIPGDKFAQDRVYEIQQILDNLASQTEKEKEDKIRFDKLIVEADIFFDAEDYIKAKNKYEEALGIFPANPYAIKRVEESVRLSKKKGEEMGNSAYQKVVDKADEYFVAENYDKAKKLYERALSLRSNDKYPREQLDEIKRILNGPVKEEASLEYLGEEVDMSILDGEALFASSEKKREQDKKQRILQRIFANEKNFDEKTSTDWTERNRYNNEIIYIKDRRNELNVTNDLAKQKLAISIDDEEFSIKNQRIQENNFEMSSIQRQNNEIIFILDDFNTIHKENQDEHLVNADKLDLIVLDKAELDRSLVAQEEVNRRVTNKELVQTADDLRADTERAIEFKKVNDDVVRNLDASLDSKSENETLRNYEKLQSLKTEATLAEIERYNSSIEKSIIQAQLEDDIALLVGLQSEKSYNEMQEVQGDALKMDALLIAAGDTYKESYADNDIARKETIEDIKVIQAGDAERIQDANNKKYQEIQVNTSEIETTKKLNEAKVLAMDEDLLAIREEVLTQEKLITQTYSEKRDAEKLARETNVDEIDKTQMNVNKVHAEESKKPGENSERVKEIESTLNLGEQARQDEFTKRKYTTSKLLEDMASNKIEFNETIANTLGDEFPEGVTQQTFLIKDNEGYPQKVTTRRIVVEAGRGEVYLRVQTRNAVTYSKNGQPITEASWLKGTENAKLVRHF